MSPFGSAAFTKSVAALEDLPESDGEIAFAGRSNAGKSSALNALARRQRLAFVSKTPGRTQLINFYRISERRFLVDLPGYGYARVPPASRATWEQLLGGYLRSRAPLRGLVLVMDIRHPLTELDQRMLDWFSPTGKPIHVLLTKADKLSRAAATATLRKAQRDLSRFGPGVSAQLFSSLKKSGLEEAENRLVAWLETSPAQPQHPDRLAEIKSPGLKG
jgi:GTP-binding protein